MTNVPGLRTLDARDASRFAPAVGAFLTALHAAPLRETAAVFPAEVYPLEQWLEDAAEAHHASRRRIPWRLRRPIRSFLSSPPPAPPTRLAFTHGDLAAAHVFVAPDGDALAAVTSWEHAATADPMVDLAALIRDLGPLVFDQIAPAYRPALDAPARARALFYARCTALEDVRAHRPHLAGLFPTP